MVDGFRYFFFAAFGWLLLPLIPNSKPNQTSELKKHFIELACGTEHAHRKVYTSTHIRSKGKYAQQPRNPWAY